MTVAAAALPQHVSPELALVDAALANELRATLEVRTVAPVAPAPALPVPADDPIADLIVLESESRVAEPSADPIVAETDQQAESWYPALPAPARDELEPMDTTETVLREIRERLTAPVPARGRRRFRRRFTVASGLSTLIVLGVFAANVSFGVTQLPL